MTIVGTTATSPKPAGASPPSRRWFDGSTTAPFRSASPADKGKEWGRLVVSAPVDAKQVAAAPETGEVQMMPPISIPIPGAKSSSVSAPVSTRGTPVMRGWFGGSRASLVTNEKLSTTPNSRGDEDPSAAAALENAFLTISSSSVVTSDNRGDDYHQDPSTALTSAVARGFIPETAAGDILTTTSAAPTVTKYAFGLPLLGRRHRTGDSNRVTHGLTPGSQFESFCQ